MRWSLALLLMAADGLGLAAARATAQPAAEVDPGQPGDPPGSKDQLATISDETARPTFEAARRAYERGLYAEALDGFQRVFVMTAHPSMLINIANSHVRLGEPKRAAAALQQYLALVPETSDRTPLEERINALLAEPQLEPPPPLAAPPPPPPPPQPAATSPEPIRPADVPSRGLIANRTFTWVALGTSVVFASVAGVLWMSANQSFERLALTCGMRGTCSTAQLETVSGGVNATNLCLAASGAALIGAVLLFVIEGGPNTSSEPPRVAASLDAHSASLLVSGRL